MKKIFIAITGLLLGVSFTSMSADEITKGLKTNPDLTEFSDSDSISYNPSFSIRSFDLDLISPSSGIQFYRDGILFLSDSKINNSIFRQISRNLECSLTF